MSKILIVPDIHYCRFSSIIRSRGKLYSTRIENCIQSINWLEDYAKKSACTHVIYLGDFFDSDNLDSEVLSSLQDIKFNDLPHICIAGNHEMSTTNNDFSSIKLLQNFQNIDVKTHPETLEGEKVSIHLLPYIYDINEDINSYFDLSDKSKKHIILSHNDLRNVYYGNFLSTSGLDIEKLSKSCDLCINGHIHNGQVINKNIINLGILTGQDFKEDAFKYQHSIFVLDIEGDKISGELVENPFAFNFLNLEVNKEEDLKNLTTLKSNAAVTIKCNESYVEDLRKLLKENKNIVHLE